MTFRHLAPATLLAFAVAACTGSVPSNPNTTIVTADFDPAAGVIPLPSALAISPALNPNLLSPRNAQEELLAYFAGQGGFPADQVVPLTFPLSTLAVNGPNDSTSTAPDIAVSSIVPCTGPHTPAGCNLLVYDASATGAAHFPPFVYTYTKGTTEGTLTVVPIDATSHRPTTWRPGALIVYAIRGGTSGVKTTTGQALQPSTTSYLLMFGQGSDFVCPSTSPNCPLPLLKTLQTQMQPVFGASQLAGFPLAETAVVSAFPVAPATTWVVADPATGVVPVPSDFMMDPTTGRVSVAAATAFGLSALSSLDGFSTTAMGLAQTSGPVKASSIRSSSGKGVYLYKIGATTPSEVGTVYVEPPPITLDVTTGHPCTVINAAGDYGPTCVSTAIGLQPAFVLPTAGGPVAFPPLEERTEYAVVVTKSVTDPTGIAMSKTTLGQMLLFTHPLCTPSPACASAPATAVSQIPGASGAQASQLEAMRLRLQPVVTKIATDHGVARTDIVMPYTFRTQSITGDALQLAAGPYAKLPSGADAFPDAPYFNGNNAADPLNPRKVAPAAMAAKWGVPGALVANGISTFIEANVITFDKLDPKTGAFDPVPANGVITPVPAIVAIPSGTAPQGGWPLVVFHHGFGRSRGDVLLIAQTLASQGMAVAGIDMVKHGARSWCTVDTTNPNAPTGCAAGKTCNTAVFALQQGDPATSKPGLCQDNALQLFTLAGTPSADPTAGNAATSGLFFVGPNFFRWRDSQRQDILDQSMLVRVLTSATGQVVLSLTAGSSVSIDPTKVYYVGQSLGAIAGTVDVAANPRISKAVLNVGGATWPDIASTSFSYRSLYTAALASLGIVEGSLENLLFLIAAHWVLDPADPANFARALVQAPLPNLFVDPTGLTPQAPKAILGQAARCDVTVPNPTNELLYGLIGLGPLDPVGVSSAPGVQWYMHATSGACADGVVGNGAPHGFLLDWTGVPGMAQNAQANAVSFLAGVPPSSLTPTPVVIP